MKKYTPNFTDPRVQNAIKRAMMFATNNLDTTNPKQIARKKLNKEIGRSESNLGNWLRQMLLVDHSQHWDIRNGICKEWLLNDHGYDKLYHILFDYKMFPETEIKYLDRKTQINYALSKEKYGPTIESANFEYKEKSDRNWNPIQNIKSEVREQVFVDYTYKHNYDLECAMVNLIVQYARKCGMGPKTQIKCLDAYIQDRSQYRQQLAFDVQCTVAEAKKVIQARFSGGTTRPGKSVHKEFSDRKCLARLVKNQWFKQFTKDLNKCWKAIAKSKGVSKLTTKEKAAEYFKLEKLIMDSVEKFIKKDKTNKYFKEHDGWRCIYPLDLNYLKSYIKNQTGYDVNISYEQVADKEITVRTPIKTAIINRGFTEQQANDAIVFYQKLSMICTLNGSKNYFKVFYKDEITKSDEIQLNRCLDHYKIKITYPIDEPEEVPSEFHMQDIEIYHIEQIVGGSFCYQGIVNDNLVHFFMSKCQYTTGSYKLYSAKVSDRTDNVFLNMSSMKLTKVKIIASDEDAEKFNQKEKLEEEKKKIRYELKKQREQAKRLIQKEEKKVIKAAKKPALTNAERQKRYREKKKQQNWENPW